MKVLEIKNILKKDIPLYYRKEFSGDVILEFMNRQEAKKVEFIIEHMPTGKVEIEIRMLESIDYPVLPVVKNLKLYILDLEKKGILP